MVNAKFNRCFQVANETQSRYRVLLGSAGSGKSVNVAQDYIIKLSDKKYSGCSLLVVRGSESSHLNSTYAELLSAISRLGLMHVWEAKSNPLTLYNKVTKNTILFRGCNDQRAIERLKSVSVANGKICWIWIEEATELQASDFEILDDRLRGELPTGLYYQITLTFNPINSSHWIKSRLWDFKSGDIFTHKSTYLDNAFIDAAYKQRMKRRKQVDPDGYEVYGLGNWGEVGGIIFPNIQVSNYSIDNFEVFTIGTDWGFNHAFACLLIGWRDGEPYILKEVVAYEKTARECAQLCIEANIPKDTVMYCDSAEPDSIKEFRRHGFRAVPVSKEVNSVRNQIAWLKSRTIHVDGSCEHTHKELKAYKYKKDKITGVFLDEPVPVDDDCIAGLRYGIEPMRKAAGLKTMSKGELKIW